MKTRLPKRKSRDGKRMQPVINVLAAGMVVCLLYLVSLSLWTLTSRIATPGNRPMLVSLESHIRSDAAPTGSGSGLRERSD